MKEKIQELEEKIMENQQKLLELNKEVDTISSCLKKIDSLNNEVDSLKKQLDTLKSQTTKEQSKTNQEQEKNQIIDTPTKKTSEQDNTSQVQTSQTQNNQAQTSQAQINQVQTNQAQINQAYINQAHLNQFQPNTNQIQANQANFYQTRPNQFQPNQFQPNQFQPNQFQPNQFQPNQFQPNQFQPNQFQPNQFQPNQFQPNQFQANQARYQQMQQNRMQNKKNYENIIGKSITGILAAILIFISITTFATLIVPNLTDVMKMIICYGISTLFIGIGLRIWHKKEKNKFAVSLIGCGFGAFYLTLLLSFACYELINESTLYTCIAIWGIILCFMTNYYSIEFSIIGESGILISTFFYYTYHFFFGSYNSFVYVVFFMFSSLIYYTFNRFKIKNRKIMIVHYVFNILNLLILLFSVYSEPKVYMWILLGLALLYLISLFTIQLDVSENHAIFAALSIAYVVLSSILISLSFKDKVLIQTLIYTLLLVVIFLTEFKRKNSKLSAYLLQIVCVQLILITFIISKPVFLYFDLLLFSIIFIAYGFIRKNEAFKVYSLVMFFVYIIFARSFSSVEYTLIYVLVAVTMFLAYILLMYMKKDQYNFVYKLIIYLLLILYPIINGSMIVNDLFRLHFNSFNLVAIITCALIAINLTIQHTSFSTNLKTKKPDNHWIYDPLNIDLMPLTLILFIPRLYLPIKIALTLFSLALFLNNTKKLLFHPVNKRVGGVYVGAKLSILIFTILQAYNMPGHFISIIFFILSIICILVGFKYEHSSLRIYGLILTLLSVLKLIIIDINYTNSIYHAFSFFVSGILCFIISIIYNKIDKS